MTRLGSNLLNAALVGAVLVMAIPTGAQETEPAAAASPPDQPAAPPAGRQSAGSPAPAEGQQPDAPSIRVVAATSKELVDERTVTGSVVARDEAVVGTDVQGLIVLQLNFDQGDTVKAGDVMAVLDKSALETQRAQNDASRAQAEAAAAQTQAQIGDAEVSVKQAQEALDRVQALRKKGVATQAQLDDAENALEGAKSRLTAAQRGLAASQAQVAVIEAQGKNIDLQIAKTEVKAPADGLVLARDATLGGIVSSGAGPLFRIAVNSEFELAADVPESVLTRLRPGMKATAFLPGVAEPLKGELRRISPEVDAKTRLGSIRITLPKDGSARVGSFARGVVEVARRQSLAIPASAVLFQDGKSFVQAVADGRVKTTPVELGIRAGALVEVTSGLQEGQDVVSRAGTFVADGDHVTPVREETTGAIAP